MQSKPNARSLRRCPDVMTITEMCDLLGVSTKTGYQLLRSGEIVAFKIGRTYRIPKLHIMDYLKISKTPNASF